MKQGIGCIYLLTNLKNGKRYVGKDSSGVPEKHRWARHIYAAFTTKDNRPLYCALRKADKELGGLSIGFSAEEIWCGSAEKLNGKEKFYIKKLHSFIDDPLGDRSYNLTKGGDGASFGVKIRLETRAKIRATTLLRYEDPEEHLKTSASMCLLYKDFTVREKLSASMRSSKKVKDGQKRRYENPVERTKTSTAVLFRYKDPEEHRKTSIGNRRAWALKSKEERSEIAVRAAITRRANRQV